MTYAKISNNELIQYPADPAFDNPSVSFPVNWGGGEIDGINYELVKSSESPSINIGWTYTESTPIFDGNTWIQTWSTSLLPNDVIKQQITKKRYEIEVSGTVISNVKFSTDRESQTKYVAVALDISQSNAETWNINWKTSSDTFINLNANQMLEIISSVRRHVQSCYDKELEYFTLMDTANTSVLESTDFSAGWPSNG